MNEDPAHDQVREPLPYLLVVNSLRGGGAERQAALLATHLPPTEICLLEQGQVYDTGSAPVHVIGHGPFRSPLPRLLEVPLLAQRLAAHRQPVVVSFLERSNFVNILSRSRAPHAVVVSERGHPTRYYSQGLRRLQLPLIRRLYPRADVVVTNSHGAARDLASHLRVPRSRLQVIPNMLDTRTIRLRAQEPLPHGAEAWFQDPVVVAMGRLSGEKGTWHLVRAFQTVRRRLRARLLLLGDGALRPYLETLVHRLGLEADVHFAGFVAQPWAFLARSTVFVLPSLWEGLPNALLEAMASGVAVIAADCRSGPREILDGPEHLDREARGVEYCAHGVLVPVASGRRWGPDDPLEPAERFLAEAMTALLEDRARRLSYVRAGLARAAMFEPARVVPLWRALIEAGVHGTPGPGR